MPSRYFFICWDHTELIPRRKDNFDWPWTRVFFLVCFIWKRHTSGTHRVPTTWNLKSHMCESLPMFEEYFVRTNQLFVIWISMFCQTAYLVNSSYYLSMSTKVFEIQYFDKWSNSHLNHVPAMYRCCRGPISNPRPLFDSSSKTTWDMFLGFFVKPQNTLVWLVIAKRCFPGIFRHKIGPLSSNRCFRSWMLE